jgi:hypothetical protein
MRRTETSTLAFLDVMACGLGAVILILVVLKQQAPIEAAPQPENIISTEQVQADLDRLQDELDNLQAARACQPKRSASANRPCGKDGCRRRTNQHRSGSDQRTNLTRWINRSALRPLNWQASSKRCRQMPSIRGAQPSRNILLA